MKIKQLLMLFVAGAFGISAADNEQFVSDNEDASYSQQADAQEGLQGFENPYLGEGFSPAESMQKQNNDDVDMTPSYDDGQSSGEFESAPEASPEDGEPSDMLRVTAEDYRDDDAESADSTDYDLNPGESLDESPIDSAI